MSISYANFRTRLLAAIVDELILIPLSIAFGYIEVNSIPSFITVSFSYSLLYAGYFIYSHFKFGQTVGKRLFSIKVVNVFDEKNHISLLQSLKREGVLLMFDVVLLVYFSIEVMKTNNIEDASHDYSSIVGNCSLAWVCIELITMLTNKKRRALHDFLGNSVVVKTV